MKQPPVIIVQLIHIEGPLKGEIQEFNLPEISIGRNPDCTVRFPKEVAVVSRLHARIVREGNRFMLLDQSTNGTFVNGKPVKEALLKDGDVLLFASGGPKISFLTQPVDSPGDSGQPPQPALSTPVEAEPFTPLPPVSTPPAQQPVSAPMPPPPIQPMPPPPSRPAFPEPAARSGETPILTVQKPLVVQYGPTLHSYNSLPVTVGKGAQCDFRLDHPAVFDRHAQIFYHADHYWVKDLTGKNLVRINGKRIEGEGMIEADCQLSLSPHGPDFRFLGGGRLAEIESPDPGPPPFDPNENTTDQHKAIPSSKGVKELGAMMRKILKRTEK